MKNFDLYQQPDYFLDSDHPALRAYVEEKAKGERLQQRLQALFYAIRDDFRYNPYEVLLRPDALKASYLLQKQSGYCIEKSNLFATGARVLGVPSRMGFAKVRNHIGTSKLESMLKTNVLVFHGYAEIWLHGKWIKVTPVFDAGLCNKLGVAPMEWDGQNDAIFQEYDSAAGQFMEYLHDYGVFHTIPFDMFVSELRQHYGHLFDEAGEPLQELLVDLSKV